MYFLSWTNERTNEQASEKRKPKIHLEWFGALFVKRPARSTTAAWQGSWTWNIGVLGNLAIFFHLSVFVQLALLFNTYANDCMYPFFSFLLLWLDFNSTDWLACSEPQLLASVPIPLVFGFWSPKDFDWNSDVDRRKKRDKWCRMLSIIQTILSSLIGGISINAAWLLACLLACLGKL